MDTYSKVALTGKESHHSIAVVTVDSLILDVPIDLSLHIASVNYRPKNTACA
jgi:hypothetical protein